MNLHIFFFVIVASLVLILLWALVIEHRLKKFFVGTKAKNLEKVMEALGKEIKEIKASQLEIKEHLALIDEKQKKSIREIKSIRFNPFIDSGSDQSFAISFLNDEGNGVVMSSLYARDRMSIFAKPIKNGKSDYELTAEEKEVLEKSK